MSAKKRVEVTFEGVEYSQIQTVRLALGIPSDREFLRYCVQQVVDAKSEAVGSARLFSSSMRDAIKGLENQQRLNTSLLLLAALHPDTMTKVLGKQVNDLKFSNPDDIVRMVQALVSNVERSIPQT